MQMGEMEFGNLILLSVLSMENSSNGKKDRLIPQFAASKVILTLTFGMVSWFSHFPTMKIPKHLA